MRQNEGPNLKKTRVPSPPPVPMSRRTNTTVLRADTDADTVGGPQATRSDILPVGPHFSGIDETRDVHEFVDADAVLGVHEQDVLVAEAELVEAAHRVGAADVRKEVEGNAVARFVVDVAQADAHCKHLP